MSYAKQVLAWLEAALPLAEWPATDVIELASALEPMALEAELVDAPARCGERWHELQRNLPQRAAELRALRAQPPASRTNRRRLLLLHRVWRQLMLLAPADPARARELARAVRERKLPAYVRRHPDGADYLESARTLPLVEIIRWLQYQEPAGGE